MWHWMLKVESVAKVILKRENFFFGVFVFGSVVRVQLSGIFNSSLNSQLRNDGSFPRFFHLSLNGFPVWLNGARSKVVIFKKL